jgi:hypothetical protein
MPFPAISRNTNNAKLFHYENLRGIIAREFPQLPASVFLLLLLQFSQEIHHVFDFSSSVFHSIFIVAVLILFVLFVVGPISVRRKKTYRKTSENGGNAEIFHYTFISPQGYCLSYNPIKVKRENSERSRGNREKMF